MLILFVRTVILYSLVLFAFRLTGKRQLSDLQPFDLIITLLIADLASEPASNMSIPLIYGIVPILALILLQQLISYLSLKSRQFRSIISGTPLIVVEKGIVVEKALKTARYTLNDLIEQMRAKDVFELSSVEYAILETNGDISILKKGAQLQPSYEDMNIPPPESLIPSMLIEDSKICETALKEVGFDKVWLEKQLKKADIKSVEDVFFAFLNPSTKLLHIQCNDKQKSKVTYIDITKENKK
ncbi:MAG: DUF421 domain-containing protein [Clostridia bacterium]|nr:DUF421 domain-containing protein [Clostridia bacterium]